MKFNLLVLRFAVILLRYVAFGRNKSIEADALALSAEIHQEAEAYKKLHNL